MLLAKVLAGISGNISASTGATSARTWPVAAAPSASSRLADSSPLAAAIR